MTRQQVLTTKTAISAKTIDEYAEDARMNTRRIERKKPLTIEERILESMTLKEIRNNNSSLNKYV